MSVSIVVPIHAIVVEILQSGKSGGPTWLKLHILGQQVRGRRIIKA